MIEIVEVTCKHKIPYTIYFKSFMLAILYVPIKFEIHSSLKFSLQGDSKKFELFVGGAVAVAMVTVNAIVPYYGICLFKFN